MDAITQQRVAEVHPELIRRYTHFDQAVYSVGIALRVSQGLRTWDQQNALFAQGRLDLETVNSLRLKVFWAPISAQENVVVTDAAPGWSAHNFGYAVDVVPSKEGFPTFQPDYNIADPAWRKVLDIALAYGLAEGAQWTMKHRDYPHLYLQELPPTPTDTMRETFKEHGLLAVWSQWPWPLTNT